MGDNKDNENKSFVIGEDAFKDIKPMTEEELEYERFHDKVHIIIHLKQRMEERGLTQMQLSEMSGVRQAAISQLSRGNIERLHIPTLEKIAWAMEIDDITQLITFELESEIMNAANPFHIKF